MSKKQPKVGDVVRFRRGTRTVQGVIREDRGPLGIGGRHLYEVEFHIGLDDEPLRRVDMPAVEFELVEQPVSTQ